MKQRERERERGRERERESERRRKKNKNGDIFVYERMYERKRQKSVQTWERGKEINMVLESVYERENVS